MGVAEQKQRKNLLLPKNTRVFRFTPLHCYYFTNFLIRQARSFIFMVFISAQGQRWRTVLDWEKQNEEFIFMVKILVIFYYGLGLHENRNIF